MTPKLVHLTIASDHVDDAAAFYRAVLGAQLDPVDLDGDRLYRGNLAGHSIVLCPSSMAGVVANRSRHQLRFEVADVEQCVASATCNGGRIHTPLERQDGRTYAVVCDPDNNTMELVGPDLREDG